MNISEIDKIWFAGFYEAEGNIYNTRITLYQNDPTPLKYAEKIWGGKLTKRTRQSPAILNTGVRSKKICICYNLRLPKNESQKFLNDIIKYLQVPRKINNILNHCNNVNLNIIINKLSLIEYYCYFAGFWEGDGFISVDKANCN